MIPTDTPVPTRPIVTPAPFVAGPAWEPFGKPLDPPSGVTSATTTVDGVRVTVRVDASTIRAGAKMAVRTSVENVGHDTLHWFSDGCEIAVVVEAPAAVTWAYGAVQPQPFKRFKDWLVERYDVNTPVWPISLRAVPEAFAGHGDYGCADIGIGHDLDPGGRIIGAYELVAVAWDDGAPPSGPFDIAASFGAWNRGDLDPDTDWRAPVVAHLPVLVTGGRDQSLLSRGQAVDVALALPLLQELIREFPTVPEFAPLDIQFDAGASTWTLHVVFGSRTSAPRPVTVVVDARTARVVEVRDPEPLAPPSCAACPSA